MDGAYIPAPWGRPVGLVINPMSYEAMGLGPRSIAFGTGAIASAVWPVANMSIGYEIRLSRATTMKIMWVCNGATASGNLDMGIYDESGTLLVSKGSTAQAGTSGASASQRLDITDTNLPAGRYYPFLAMDGVVGTTQRLVPATTADQLAALGMVQVASNFPLASSVTFAKITQSYLPWFGPARVTVF